MPNATGTPPRGPGRRQWRRPLPSLRERAQTLYASVPAEVYDRLPDRLQNDTRRAKCTTTSCHPSIAQRAAEQARAYTAAGDFGFADGLIQLIRDAAIDPYQESLPLTIGDTVLTAQRCDVEEDAAEVEAFATQFADRNAVLRFADASARAGRAEMLKAAALRRHAETLRENAE